MTTSRTLTPLWMRKLAVLASAGLVVASISACGGGSNDGASSAAMRDDAAVARQESDARVAFLQQRADADPLDTFGLNSLAQEYIQRARDTGDVSELTRAQAALERSLSVRMGDNYEALALLGNITVTQHDFARGRALAQAAIAMRPDAAYGYGVLGDAYMGLGRYDDARAAYDTMLSTERGVSSVSRQALLSEVFGDNEQAIAQWQEVVALAAEQAPEHTAWAHVQLANARFVIGDVAGAQDDYQSSLDALPGYVHALAGLGRVAAANGDLPAAIDYYTRAVERVPLPEYVIALGEVYEANGDGSAAQEQYALVAAIEQLYAASGVRLDLQIAMFNADTGRDLQSNAERAAAVYAASPSIEAADALAWARYAAGDVSGARESIEQALRTGGPEPITLFHAAKIYAAAGDDATALRHLEMLSARNMQFSVRYADDAQALLAELRAEATR